MTAASQRKARKKAPPKPRRRFWWRVLRWPVRLAVGALALVILWVAAYRVIDPPGGLYMAREAIRLGGVRHEWRDIDEIAPALGQSAMAGEDARFCDHHGFDFQAIRAAMEVNERGHRLLGASTISQQVAKNVFLWHGRSWVRKGLEAGFTALVELLWPKRRILEVYLNTVEFGPGVFGAEAGAEHHFHRSADRLTGRQAALMAAALPAPKTRNPARPTAYVSRRARAIEQGAETLAAQGRDDCVYPGGG